MLWQPLFLAYFFCRVPQGSVLGPSSLCTLLLPVLSIPFLLTTTFIQMTLSSFFLSNHPILTQAFLTFKTLFNRSFLGWLLIFLLSTPLRLNSCSSDSKPNLPKYKTLHFTPPTLLEILASSLTNILLSLTKLLLSPKPVTITFVNFAVSGLTSIRQLPVPLLPLSSTSNLNFCRLIISHWRPHHVFKRAATIPWSVHFLPVFFCAIIYLNVEYSAKAIIAAKRKQNKLNLQIRLFFATKG